MCPAGGRLERLTCLLPCLVAARGSTCTRSSEAGLCSARGLRFGTDRASAIGFNIVDTGGAALALERAQFRHQIPLALARHGECNVIAEHAFTLVQRRRSLNTFSPM